MRPGKPVVYVDSKGREHAAVVTEVTGTGPSWYKRLSLTYGDGEVREDVPHENDADGRTFWREHPVGELEEGPAPAPAEVTRQGVVEPVPLLGRPLAVEIPARGELTGGDDAG